MKLKGVSRMRRKWISFLLALLVLCLPASAAAAPFKLGIAFTMPESGVVCTELTYNDEVLWKVQLLADGAKPVTTGGGHTMILVPDITNGLFTLKVSSN